MSTVAPQPDSPHVSSGVSWTKVALTALGFALAFGSFWYWRTATDYERQGWDALKAADYDRAVERFTKLINRNPANPDGYYLRGQAFAYRRDFAPALADAEWLIERKDLGGQSLRGFIRLIQHRYRDALKDFDAVVADGQPRCADHLNRADAYLGLYQLDAADDAVRVALACDPKSADARSMLGRIAAARFDFAGAVKYYSEAIDLEPTSSTHYAYRAAAHVELKDEEAAAADLAVATRLTPRDDFPDRLRSVVFLNRGEYDRALVAADRALEIAPWNPDGYFGRAWLRHYRKEYQLSVSDYDECLRLTPDDAYAHAGRVYSLIKLRDYDGAFRSAEASRGLLPSGPDGDTALAWLLATCPDESRRDPSRAMFHAQQACRRTFERGRLALQSLAAAHAARGAFAEAVHWQQKAMAAPGWRPRDEWEFGTALLKLYQDGKPYRSP